MLLDSRTAEVPANPDSTPGGTCLSFGDRRDCLALWRADLVAQRQERHVRAMTAYAIVCFVEGGEPLPTKSCVAPQEAWRHYDWAVRFLFFD